MSQQQAIRGLDDQLNQRPICFLPTTSPLRIWPSSFLLSPPPYKSQKSPRLSFKLQSFSNKKLKRNSIFRNLRWRCRRLRNSFLPIPLSFSGTYNSIGTIIHALLIWESIYRTWKSRSCDLYFIFDAAKLSVPTVWAWSSFCSRSEPVSRRLSLILKVRFQIFYFISIFFFCRNIIFYFESNFC